MSRIDRCIENYLNGNLADAKAMAKRHGRIALYNRMRNVYGWSIDKSLATANYLKGRGSWQAACDSR